MATLETSDHEAQMAAYLDALEPFNRWRDVLYGGLGRRDGEAG